MFRRFFCDKSLWFLDSSYVRQGEASSGSQVPNFYLVGPPITALAIILLEVLSEILSQTHLSHTQISSPKELGNGQPLLFITTVFNDLQHSKRDLP